MGFGDYPPEYDAKIHGPYDPARYYGKPDIPFAEVKVGEVTAWLSRRKKSPRGLAGAVSRAWWRWNHKYVFPKRGGIAPVVHLLFGSMLFFYVINYGNITPPKLQIPLKLMNIQDSLQLRSFGVVENEM